ERNPEHKRARYLKPNELQRLTAALAAHPNREGANVLRLLLLTGARRGEVLGLRWDQLDIEAGVWTKPAAMTKQKAEHRVPLSAPARQLLAEMRAEVDSGEEIAAALEREADREHHPKKAATKRHAAARVRARKASPFVFIGRGGTGVPVINIRRLWVGVCEMAG